MLFWSLALPLTFRPDANDGHWQVLYEFDIRPIFGLYVVIRPIFGLYAICMENMRRPLVISRRVTMVSSTLAARQAMASVNHFTQASSRGFASAAFFKFALCTISLHAVQL